MSVKSLIPITLMIDDRAHGMRYWPVVPRVGDLVSVKVHSSIQKLEVEKVVWLKADRNDKCEVDVYLTETD